MSILKTLILAAGSMFLGFIPVQAQRNLTIGAQSAPSGMDPHYDSSNPNNAILRQIFETLVDFDTSGRLVPRLAESWRAIDNHTWEFRLRDSVKFHDGAPFSAEDLAFSYARVPTIANSPGPFTPFIRSIATIEIPEPRRALIRTREPNPFLDWDLSNIMILSRTLHANATLGDFNAGRAMIGTGAYRHVGFSQGERHEITRNPNYWGETQPWERVVTRFISNAGARVATLLSGDVDLIDFVPVQDVQRLTNDPRLSVFGVASNGTAYIFPNAAPDPPPFVTDKQGRVLERNPLRDARVRRALSLAINRQGIVDRLLMGQGMPAE
ncbi:MAG: hypothetical protein FJX33_09465 [Alphaproteobacteria bacterium]|nr:hypothetical protein [Alphaproteobacteria bacterium]